MAICTGIASWPGVGTMKWVSERRRADGSRMFRRITECRGDEEADVELIK